MCTYNKEVGGVLVFGKKDIVVNTTIDLDLNVETCIIIDTGIKYSSKDEYILMQWLY